MLSKAFDRHRGRNKIVLQTIKVLIVALAAHEQLVKRISGETKINERDRIHFLVFDEKRREIEKWLDRFIFYPSVEKDLKVRKNTREKK